MEYERCSRYGYQVDADIRSLDREETLGGRKLLKMTIET